MKKLRLLLLVPAAMLELLMLGSCWVIALFSPSAAENLMRFATSILPGRRWYVGAKSYSIEDPIEYRIK